MLSDNNKYLLVKPDVKLNSFLDAVITELEPFFEQVLHIAFVTSGIRTPEEQLQIIKNLCAEHEIEDYYLQCSKIDSFIYYNNEKTYTWQFAWSKLLNEGILVNPPLEAKVLYDYIKDGINKKGELIKPSSHFYGTSFDIGGGLDGVENELAIIKKANLPSIKSYTIERKNNCIHININLPD